jgi:large subunit ribosomal protein L10
MSKPVKELVVADYRKRFGDLEGALVVDIRGINANDNNALRMNLATKEIRVTVVKNTLARQSFAGTRLEGLSRVLDGPAAIAYGGTSVVDVARALVEWAKKIDKLSLKGAILDGEVYSGAAGVKRLSTFPTRVEAQAKVVQLILSPARNVVGAAVSPGARVLAIVKEITDRLEKGTPIAKVG